MKSKLQQEKLKVFFLTHLNRIYSAKSYLVKHLPEIEDLANFADLKYAIAETVDEVKKQIKRMRNIFLLLDAEISLEQPKSFSGMIEDTFTAVKQQSDDLWLRDMSILFYMQNIESAEMASFKILHLVAAKLKDEQIKQLLKENFDEAKEDHALMMMITAKYMTN